MDGNELIGRKLWKKNARATVRKHYILLVVLCLIAALYGNEFNYVTAHTNDTYNLITGQDPDDTGIVVRIDGKSLLEIAAEKLGIDLGSSAAERQAKMASIQESGSEKLKEIKGGERGILSSVASLFTSGKLVNTLVEAGGSVFHSKKIVETLLIIAALLVTLFISIFLKNVYIAILRRMFLEARAYDRVPASHIMHFRIFGRWIRASLSMLLVTIYEMLWWVTIIGGVIKHYSYLLVPYIIAENPDIRPKDAVLLSRRMMDGHKMEAFWIDVSFVGWHLLGILSFGIAEAMWAVPYKTATLTEYYAERREGAKAERIEGSEYLNDTYLFEKADRELLEEVYVDIEAHKLYIDIHRVTLSPVKAFFAKNFGLWIGNYEEKKEYDAVDNKRQQIAADRAAIRGEMYPQRLNPLWKEDSYRIVRSARSLRTYTIWSVIIVFFIFSFIGWGWEVCIHLVKDGVFVNRGVMHGPWLPVYGSGVAMIVIILARWRKNPAAEALLTILLCGFVEYMTSYYLEVTKGMRWWDYTGYFLNLNGRICCEGLMVFALGGMAAVYLLVPLIDTTLSHLNPKVLAVVSILLVVGFTADMIYSSKNPNIGEGITDYDAYKKSAVVQYDSELSPESPECDSGYGMLT